MHKPLYGRSVEFMDCVSFFTFVAPLIVCKSLATWPAPKSKYKALQTRMLELFAITLPRESFLSSRIVGASREIGRVMDCCFACLVRTASSEDALRQLLFKAQLGWKRNSGAVARVGIKRQPTARPTERAKWKLKLDGCGV